MKGNKLVRAGPPEGSESTGENRNENAMYNVYTPMHNTF
ncbi:unnamed protein product [Acanthoscelides obtectus]|uniref:Uncharacterized protein n=1 Tax=Acanthoscelides obtectus TaxID=200917 RepID=A0A9P0L8A5_ACAOB|nr:unnamed protein product [Acanthoscelides obtectus]CAK1632917.1 hypothetical protein AOBTE_LOCUS7815 [Acanthoscelides obtectus]